MASILDVIGAAIVGSLVLLMMFTSLFNMQVINYNTQIQTNLSQMSEDLITGRTVGNVNYLGLETYLSKVGAGVPETTDPIIEATSYSFKFLGKVNSTSSIYSTFHFVQESLTSDGYPLYVYQDDMSSGNHILGPFWLADSLDITYYDMNNLKIISPDSNHDSIRSAKVSLSFFYNTHRPDIDKKLLRHNIVLWKYFKNLYL